MERIGRILPTILRQRGFSDHVAAAQALELAARAIEKHLPTLAPSLRPASLRDGTITIEASEHLALVECSGHTEAILAFIKEADAELPVLHVKIFRA